MTTATAGSAPAAWLERAARIGYAAKGVVYVLIGGFSAAAAFTASDHKGSSGVLETIIRQPFGRLLLAIVGLGLVGYAVWRLVQALFDPERKGTDLKGLTLRGYYLVSFLVHGALVLAAARMVLGQSSSAGGGSPSGDTAFLLSQPFGRLLVGTVALAILGSAVYQFRRAYAVEFRKRLALHRVSYRTARWLIRLGRFGLAARGVVFAIIGGFLAVAAWQANPSEARGLPGALRTLETSVAGPWLLLVVALGLCAYGAHQFVKARYRRIG